MSNANFNEVSLNSSVACAIEDEIIITVKPAIDKHIIFDIGTGKFIT